MGGVDVVTARTYTQMRRERRTRNVAEERLPEISGANLQSADASVRKGEK